MASTPCQDKQMPYAMIIRNVFLDEKINANGVTQTSREQPHQWL